MREVFIEGVRILDSELGELYNEGMKRLVMIFIMMALGACSTRSDQRAQVFGEHLADQAAHDSLYYDFDNDGIRDDYHF